MNQSNGDKISTLKFKYDSLENMTYLLASHYLVSKTGIWLIHAVTTLKYKTHI